jgi:predicted DNA-binding protein with PD1-like motif
MNYKKIGAEGEQTYALVLDPGEEVGEQLLAFARKLRVTAAHFQGIGALSDVVLGWFDWERKQYRPIPIREQVEVLSLQGDVAVTEGGGNEPRVHAHLVVGRADGTAYGGHLLSAHVRPTLEVIFAQSPRYLRRRMDRATGLPLIDPSV